MHTLRCIARWTLTCVNTRVTLCPGEAALDPSMHRLPRPPGRSLAALGTCPGLSTGAPHAPLRLVLSPLNGSKESTLASGFLPAMVIQVEWTVLCSCSLLQRHWRLNSHHSHFHSPASSAVEGLACPSWHMCTRGCCVCMAGRVVLALLTQSLCA